MRIEAYAQVQQLYNTKKTKQVQNKEKVSFADQVQISSLGKDIQTAKQAVADSPDIREELTASIKDRIQKGTYEVSDSDFADKLLRAYDQRI